MLVLAGSQAWEEVVLGGCGLPWQLLGPPPPDGKPQSPARSFGILVVLLPLPPKSIQPGSSGVFLVGNQEFESRNLDSKWGLEGKQIHSFILCPTYSFSLGSEPCRDTVEPVGCLGDRL